MANIVTIQDFNGGSTNIPNLDLVGSNLQTNYIEKYEPKFIKDLLGNDLYIAYLSDPEAERFVNLIPYLRPAIVDYVFYYYIEDNGGNMLFGSGVGNSKKQNAVTSSPWPLMVKAWNEMVDYNKETNKFLDDNKTDYPEYKTPLPSWYFWNGFYPLFDWNWYSWYGCHLIPGIYKLKNGLGL
jgi:hypothetical protein